jgi:sugar lactone lactonase YvrE
MGQWRALPVAGRLFESARWLEHEQCFQWVDILTARIFRWAPDTDALDCIDLGFDFLTLATPQTPGVQLLASRDTLYTYRWGDAPEPFVVLPVGAGARLNDGIVDDFGRTWIGSMGLVPNRDVPLGKLWRIDASGSATEVLSGLGISNGIAWADRTTGFHVDSLVGALYALTDEGGSLSRSMALKFSSPVEPDGILLADGVVWIALWGGGALGRLDPSTGHYSEAALPASRPSSLAMSPELVLVTAAGQGNGSELDLSGQVLVAPVGSLEAGGDAHRSDEGRARVPVEADAWG